MFWIKLLATMYFFFFSEFTSNILSQKCYEFISRNMEKYFAVIQNRIESEKEADDSVILVRALDKFCRKLQTANVLTPRLDFTTYVLYIIMIFNVIIIKNSVYAIFIHFIISHKTSAKRDHLRCHINSFSRSTLLAIRNLHHEGPMSLFSVSFEKYLKNHLLFVPRCYDYESLCQMCSKYSNLFLFQN